MNLWGRKWSRRLIPPPSCSFLPRTLDSYIPLDRGVPLPSCSSKAQPLYLTSDEGYLLKAAPPALNVDQLLSALRCPSSHRLLDMIIGCQVTREPPNSTERYTRWINQLAPDQLLTQVFTSNGPTVIMPTWFCSRAWFTHVGPFDEGGRGVPEDLLFFYEHLRQGGAVVRVDRSLLLYRCHPGAATHTILETTIWAHRVRFLEEQALPHWATFTIWNAGRQGRRLYRSLTAGSRRKVAAFCDVDENKIRKGFYCYEDSQERPKPRIPVVHFRAARPPFVICVKLDLTGGVFEDNLRSLNLQEGRDFLHFS
ncbi:UDP-GlcNAc:betaGal beta-1,3-N-acetylglucosaminyltransferase-like protein 1 isoform X4 [Moschus berezovskii]|uniref:UDP-GlcNAc:betaGal beta-1,3-N-acetylglucosaminyltransferase-like protein 1 isoform X4 n=1 Tax=Moschus berezovskii TaxID=68408 RepID=UPI0024445767|nr:UDP-GlcNAc:betaGal beta-1,3-N-acetylglucosaminyltransferase-like protein 1 isoform X4 [Moschus berezovskii]